VRKKRLATIVLVMVGSLSIAGCINLSAPASPTAPSVTEIHPDPTLKAYVDELNTSLARGTNLSQGKANSTHWSQWEEQWLNDTAVNVGYIESTGNLAHQVNETIQRFATIPDASAFVNTNSEGLKLISTDPSITAEGSYYNQAIGRMPTVGSSYSNQVDDAIAGFYETPSKTIVQVDDMVMSYQFTPTSTATPSAAPSAAPTATTAGFDPILTKMADALSKQYNTTVSKWPKNATQDRDTITVSVEGANGKITTAEISNYGTTAAATGIYKMMATPISNSVSSPASVTYFGEQAATVALGHTPTTVNDYYSKGTGDYAGLDNEYIQYDQLFIATTVTSPLT